MNKNLIPLLSYLSTIQGFSKGSGEILELLFKGNVDALESIFNHEGIVKAFWKISKDAEKCLEIINKELGLDEELIEIVCISCNNIFKKPKKEVRYSCENCTKDYQPLIPGLQLICLRCNKPFWSIEDSKLCKECINETE